MIEAVCTGRLIIMKKYDLSVLNLKDLLQVLPLNSKSGKTELIAAL